MASSPLVPGRDVFLGHEHVDRAGGPRRAVSVVARKQRDDHDTDDEERDAREHQQIRSTHDHPLGSGTVGLLGHVVVVARGTGASLLRCARRSGLSAFQAMISMA